MVAGNFGAVHNGVFVLCIDSYKEKTVKLYFYLIMEWGLSPVLTRQGTDPIIPEKFNGSYVLNNYVHHNHVHCTGGRHRDVLRDDCILPRD